MNGRTQMAEIKDLKYNPFRPNDIIHTGMFVGRIDELDTIERCLFQAKHGNPLHFIAQGERGIGKSSLLFIVKMLANGMLPPATAAEPFRFLSVSVDLGGCSTQIDVVRKIARGLRKEIASRQVIKEKAKAFWDWITNWEVLGVSYNKDSIAFDMEEIVEQFVENIAVFCDAAESDIDGILFLIDEADRPPVEAALGSYLKMISERLKWRSCERVIFGLAGLPTLLGKLRESHESSPRLFHTMLLEPLEMEERKRVVRNGIEEANKKNSIATKITDEAVDFLAELSEGYPHFIQQFAYSAFQQDTDNIIDDEDVGNGAFKEGGALTQLGDKFFNDMYHARVSSEEYRRVLDTMADHGDGWVSRKTIIKESGVSEANVTNALRALKMKEVIIQDESQRGLYRLPTNSFAAWINAIRAARAKSDVAKGARFEG
ncbi:ATP-binding protein [Mesorhizobium sp. CA12]|uniref:ATP-binding protein n=1 Tax=Mesorhizobium sp. CA12 TaxID=2876644 RepID=UPI001CCAF6AE|nr:ATP-binding protein [Mesorhizobium sp. CA12]MBZ9859587.1 ATP-binding protein [Mesorhizobium sp. CA12]